MVHFSKHAMERSTQGQTCRCLSGPWAVSALGHVQRNTLASTWFDASP